jgi:hypothetical protein
MIRIFQIRWVLLIAQTVLSMLGRTCPPPPPHYMEVRKSMMANLRNMLINPAVSGRVLMPLRKQNITQSDLCLYYLRLMTDGVNVNKFSMNNK